jgi:hypothetical protein
MKSAISSAVASGLTCRSDTVLCRARPSGKLPTHIWIAILQLVIVLPNIITSRKVFGDQSHIEEQFRFNREGYNINNYCNITKSILEVKMLEIVKKLEIFRGHCV